jgi:hypothetical protein
MEQLNEIAKTISRRIKFVIDLRVQVSSPNAGGVFFLNAWVPQL